MVVCQTPSRGVCYLTGIAFTILDSPYFLFVGGEDSVISSALHECSFFRHSPGTKNQILPSPSSFLLCVFPYLKSQQEEAQPCKCSTAVIFSNCKLRTMPRTLPSRRTVLGIFELESTANWEAKLHKHWFSSLNFLLAFNRIPFFSAKSLV